MLDTIIYVDSILRAKRICLAMVDGITRCGDKCNVKNAQTYNGEIEADVAIFYGLREKLKTVFETYKSIGKKAILIDLGYWDRTKGGKLEGYHRIAINDHHPTKYFQNIKHDNTRSNQLDLTLKEFNKKGDHLLIAGMSGKSAWANDMQAHEYEEWAIKNLKVMTHRPLMYRPKPSWKSALKLEGADMYSAPETDLKTALENCWSVVTHHSNVSIDALLNGIPVIVNSNAPASVLGKKDFNDIENPYYPSEQELLQWINDLSYTQWRPSEMESGEVWSYLKDTKLLVNEDI